MKNDPRYLLDYDRPVRYIVISIRVVGYPTRWTSQAHTDNAFLFNPKLIVRESGRLKVNKEKSKNVHAWLSGILHENPSRVHEIGNSQWRMVTYDPYKYKSFVTKSDKQPITNAKQAWMMTPYVWVKQ